MPDSSNPETIDGFDIPFRELTEEEANQTITWERFRDFHCEVGEDYLDQTGHGDIKILVGWLLHKYPDFSLDILDVVNCKYPSLNDLIELECYEYDEDRGVDPFYDDFAEFCNQTKHLKRRVNTVLILAMEAYGQ